VKVTTTDRGFSVDIYELISDMPEDFLRTLADAVAVQDCVVRYVAQQILDGWTELNSSNGRYCVAISEPQTGLDWAVREVARRAGEVAAEEIKRLERGIVYRDEEIAGLRKEFERFRRCEQDAANVGLAIRVEEYRP
jgi:stage III sporulation protein SpoIIIAA